MTPPEQLPLDFSTPDIPELAPDARTPASVIALQPFRQAREARRLRDAYQAIFDSVSHIRLDRVRVPDSDC